MKKQFEAYLPDSPQYKLLYYFRNYPKSEKQCISIIAASNGKITHDEVDEILKLVETFHIEYPLNHF